MDAVSLQSSGPTLISMITHSITGRDQLKMNFYITAMTKLTLLTNVGLKKSDPNSVVKVISLMMVYVG